VWLRPRYWGNGATGWKVKAVVDRRMTYVAVGFMVDRMFRVSNVAAPGSSTATDHAVRAQDLLFIYHGGKEVLNLGEARRRTKGRAGLEAINVTAYTSKGNKIGRAEDGLIGGAGVHAQQLLRDMHTFCMHAGGSEIGQLFERCVAGDTKRLLPSMTAAAIKEAAAGLGLDPAYFGNHSARHCGAGMMTALQEEIRSIEKRGDWVPDSKVAKKVYMRLAMQNASRGPLTALDEAGPAQRKNMIDLKTLRTAVAVRQASRR
jgi:hypothetical protein